ncbi:hypothetical protein, partial [Pseudorhodoferax sp. Leaf274]|uniref:hypothetical protein n=1 Tax=Pseudorhodoferax sp. Leaf274 TaxID=1736318 RepID=UPI00070256A3
MTRSPTLPVGGRGALAQVARYILAAIFGIALGSVYRLDAAPARPTTDAEPAARLQHAMLLAQQADREREEALRDAQRACRAARGTDAVMFTTPEGHLVCRR